MRKMTGRTCSRASCTNAAIKTLCASHSERLTVPVGWSVIKQEPTIEQSGPSDDDLMAIANAVREVANSDLNQKAMPPELGRRGHLRALPSN